MYMHVPHPQSLRDTVDAHTYVMDTHSHKNRQKENVHVQMSCTAWLDIV
jgi:hypothetical protein